MSLRPYGGNPPGWHYLERFLFGKTRRDGSPAMSADLVFATAKPGEAFVFRHNFSENKWENVASKNASSTVTFRKRDGAFFIRIAPDGGDKVWRTPHSLSSLSGVQEEHQLSAAALVKDSGQGFIQVPLPDRRQIIGIKFNSSEQAAIFLAKIRAEMSECVWVAIYQYS